MLPLGSANDPLLVLWWHTTYSIPKSNDVLFLSDEGLNANDTTTHNQEPADRTASVNGAAPNLHSSSERFFVTENDEVEDGGNGDAVPVKPHDADPVKPHGAVLVKPHDADPVKLSDNSRPISSGSTRSILKDMPSRPLSRERRIGSAGDASRLSDSRPSTGQDPKKAVRFAEEDSVEIISARNRSKSAMPRLSSQNKEKSVKSGSCKSDDVVKANRKDDDHDHAEPDGRGDRYRRSNSWTVSKATGSATSNNKSGTGANNTKSGKQSSNKVYDTRESLNSVVFSKDNVSKMSLPPRPPSASRLPRSRLGAWEDLCKPDSDLTSLAIQGSNVDADPDMLEMKHLVSYDFMAFNNARKMSAENLRVSGMCWFFVFLFEF